MKRVPNIIKAIYIDGTGDPSVGMFPYSARILGSPIIEFCPSDSNTSRIIELNRLRMDLGQAFSSFWDDTAKIVFDFELPDEDEL